MMPTVLISGIEEKLFVPFRPQNGALDDAGSESELSHGALHPVTGGGVHCRIADDTALADLTLAGLELGFDQYNQLRVRRSEHRRQSREDKRNGDEADVADDEIDRLADLVRVQIARVDAFVHDHARVGAQLPVELPRADIHGVNAAGAVLKQE